MLLEMMKMPTKFLRTPERARIDVYLHLYRAIHPYGMNGNRAAYFWRKPNAAF